MLKIKAYFDDATATVTYLVWDSETLEAAIIDPVLDFEPNRAAITTASADAVLADVDANRLTLTRILETHAHADHLSAGDYIRQKTGAKLGIGAYITEVQSTFRPLFHADDVNPDGQRFDRLFEDGEILTLGNLKIEVLHTPGHTPACVSYLIADAIFVGDTLFMPDYGTARADFPGGDAATLYRSIRRILALPTETRIFVGHDYPPAERGLPAWETTVKEQRAGNLHIRDGVSEAEFVAMRTKRDSILAAPRLILPSLQVNIRAGALPPKESDGHVYLKLPVNRLSAA